MKLSYFEFVFACSILYTFHSNVLNPMATEIMKLGACPGNIKGYKDFKLEELNGVYSVLAMYSKDRLIPRDSCYKIRFKPINEDGSEVRVVWKSGLLQLPIKFDFWFEKISKKNEEQFKILDSLTGTILLGQAFIFEKIGNDTLLFYSCRPGFLFHHQEVLVLTKNETISYTAEENKKVGQILKEHKLDYGYLKDVDQNRESCADLIKSYL
ncbi:uncharacterized protein LOC123296256 [Chrysoperla carnea]|uniref:uncharacterized protein LOC123296256 n=1 Tax=Chrysoperla carnea TaxID=189513 RepID=UPI001D08FB77|nr:uncharacterized protein LOC123296256 [Chrysoperla carnea]